jgi:hypothetical protein
MCWTSNTNPFFYDVAKCYVRDKQNVYSGVDGCVNGGTGDNDSSVQCVNTIMNNTVRSGKPIISTKPPTGVAADAAWTEQLYKDFIVNLSGGVSGYPLEMFFNSVSQLIADNESAGSSSKFFRPDSLRVIVFVTDEDDQSTTLGTTQVTPDDHYDWTCNWKTVGGHTYRLQVCPKPANVIPVSTFKQSLDTFFLGLDGKTEGNPNYFITTITPTSGNVVKQLHDELGENANSYGAVSSDYPTRLFALADAVGNGSLKMEITSNDYSPILDAIGQTVVTKKNRFKLRFQPTGKQDLMVSVKHSTGTLVRIPDSDYEIEGFEIVVTNDDIMLGLSDSDRIVIDYQPSSLNE